MEPKLKAPETDEEWTEFAADFDNFILEKWKTNGTVVNEEDTKMYIDMFTTILCNYRLKCALKTMIEIDDLQDEFASKYNWED